MSDSRKKANNSAVKTPVEYCPKPTVDLEYLDCHGNGIAGAKYQVYSVNWDGKKDGKFSKTGTLDGTGKAHIDNVPEVKALKYYFEKDPKPYEPKQVPSETPDREAAASMLDSIAIWLVGTAQGDFNKEQTVGQITVNALLGLIPVVDQVLDARDLTAGLKAIIDYYMEDEADQQKHPDELGLDYEKWIWINVFIISIGCIPIVGSAVKGVLKGVVHYLKQAGKVAGKLSPSQLRAGWEFLVAILNKFGVGNAHKWLSTEFPSKIDGWMAKASDTIRGGLDTIKQAADKAVAGVSFFSSAKAAELAERAKAYKKGIDKAKSKVDEMANQVKSWFKEQVQTLTAGGAHKSEQLGATGTKGRPIPNERKQKAAEPPDLPSSVRRQTSNFSEGLDEYPESIAQRRRYEEELRIAEREPILPKEAEGRERAKSDIGNGDIIDFKNDEVKGSVVTPKHLKEKSLEDFNRGGFEEAKRLSRDLGKCKSAKEISQILDQDVKLGLCEVKEVTLPAPDGRRINGGLAGSQTMKIFEYPDGTIVRVKFEGDPRRNTGMAYSVEAKHVGMKNQDGSWKADAGPESIAFKLDKNGNPVPKNPTDTRQVSSDPEVQEGYINESMDSGHRGPFYY